MDEPKKIDFSSKIDDPLSTMSSLLDETISIPKYGHGESLNVAISGAILLSGLSGCFHDKNL